MHNLAHPNLLLNQRFAITTLGCKVNQFEGGSLAEQLVHAGYQQVPFSDVADIYIINSCTVTTRSDRDSRRLIRRAKRQNPEARIVVTGCYAQVAPEELHALPDVTQVIGNADKQHFLTLLHQGVSQVTSYQDAPDTPVLPLTAT
jgi:threonylcarbamoyladenosine tRNA methylthiotransferase MtaB